MPKPRKIKNISKELTELLDNEELKVIEGSNCYDYVVMSPDTGVPICIECSGKVKNQGRFNKTYIDVVTINKQKQFARLHYYFYKYLCLNEECGALFQKPMHFASEKARITRRYEDEVMKHIFHESIDKTIADMSGYVVKNHYRDLISKPAIGKLIKRWVAEKDDKRINTSPSVLCIYTFKTQTTEYTFFWDASLSKMNLLEVVPSVTESKTNQVLTKIDTTGIRAVVSDCNPSVTAAIRNYFPIRKIYINSDSVLQILKSEFKEYVDETLKNYRKTVRGLFLIEASETIQIDYDDMSKIRSIKKRDSTFGRVYDNYLALYGLFHRGADIADVKDWELNLDEVSSNVFAMTISYIDEYSTEIANYQAATKGNDKSYYDVCNLVEQIEASFPKSTDEVYRGRLLYCDFENNKQDAIHTLELQKIREQIQKMIKQEEL